LAIDFEMKPPAAEGRNRGSEKAATPAREPQPPRGKWLKRVVGLLIVAGLIAAGVKLFNPFSSEQAGDLLTHTIARGDLVVSVSEEGSLESASNIEIKCRVKGGGTIVWIIEDGTEVEPGDELVRFDTSVIEENVSQQQIACETARAALAQSESDLAVARIAVTEYVEGTYVSELKTAESNVALSEANVAASENIVEHSRRMFRMGYQSQLDVTTNEITLKQAQLQLEVDQAALDALQRFTRAKTVEELQAAVKAAEAKVASDKAKLELETLRLEREQQQLENCVVRAETSGMVLYSTGRPWDDTPSYDVGATVAEQQTLLIIPDLTCMQVKIGIHESKIQRVRPGLPARVEFRGESLDGEVVSVASVTEPTGWWNGNKVAYDTIISMESQGDDLKPGMSAEVEVFIARHEDVVRVPVAAVVQLGQEFYCWVQADGRTERRTLQLGDSNDQFIVVNAGLSEGDEVVLNPDRFIEQAREEVLRPVDETPPAADPDARQSA
jgi:multidrug efflux pump subunit AcrA (membrane-fusion protein)